MQSFLNKNKKQALPNENYNQVLFCFLSPSMCRQHFPPFCHLSSWEFVDLHTLRLYFSLPHSLSHNKQSGSTRVKIYMQRSLAISRWPNPGAFLQWLWLPLGSVTYEATLHYPQESWHSHLCPFSFVHGHSSRLFLCSGDRHPIGLLPGISSVLPNDVCGFSYNPHGRWRTEYSHEL